VKILCKQDGIRINRDLISIELNIPFCRRIFPDRVFPYKTLEVVFLTAGQSREFNAANPGAFAFIAVGDLIVGYDFAEDVADHQILAGSGNGNVIERAGPFIARRVACSQSFHADVDQFGPVEDARPAYQSKTRGFLENDLGTGPHGMPGLTPLAFIRKAAAGKFFLMGTSQIVHGVNLPLTFDRLKPKSAIVRFR